MVTQLFLVQSFEVRILVGQLDIPYLRLVSYQNGEWVNDGNFVHNAARRVGAILQVVNKVGSIPTGVTNK